MVSFENILPQALLRINANQQVFININYIIKIVKINIYQHLSFRLILKTSLLQLKDHNDNQEQNMKRTNY